MDADAKPEPLPAKLELPPRLSEKVAPTPPPPVSFAPTLDAFEIMLPEEGEFMFEVVISRLPLFPAPVSTLPPFMAPVVINRLPLLPAPVSVDPTVPTPMVWGEFPLGWVLLLMLVLVLTVSVEGGGGGGGGGDDSVTLTVMVWELVKPAASVTLTVIGYWPDDEKS